jgi:hypothetical protein
VWTTAQLLLQRVKTKRRDPLVTHAYATAHRLLGNVDRLDACARRFTLLDSPPALLDDPARALVSPPPSYRKAPVPAPLPVDAPVPLVTTPTPETSARRPLHDAPRTPFLDDEDEDRPLEMSPPNPRSPTVVREEPAILTYVFRGVRMPVSNSLRQDPLAAVRAGPPVEHAEYGPSEAVPPTCLSHGREARYARAAAAPRQARAALYTTVHAGRFNIIQAPLVRQAAPTPRRRALPRRLDDSSADRSRPTFGAAHIQLTWASTDQLCIVPDRLAKNWPFIVLDHTYRIGICDI